MLQQKCIIFRAHIPTLLSLLKILWTNSYFFFYCYWISVSQITIYIYIYIEIIVATILSTFEYVRESSVTQYK